MPIFNYAVLPPRLTPGLGLTLPKCSIAVGRATLALGLTLAGLIARGSAAVRHSLASGGELTDAIPHLIHYCHESGGRKHGAADRQR